jgi:uncharacterized delta-60 repeat protein
MSHQIVFLDSRVGHTDAFLASLPADAELIVIDAAADGVQQMADALAGRSGLDAIHIISHGSPGSLLLGSTSVNAARLKAQAASWRSIGHALTDQGDLLLYGCNVAQGEAGAAYVRVMADLTGADVAASVDVTGAADSGGNGVLEMSTGLQQISSLALPMETQILAANTTPVLSLGEGRVITTVAADNYGDLSGIFLRPDGKIVVAGTAHQSGMFRTPIWVGYAHDGAYEASFTAQIPTSSSYDDVLSIYGDVHGSYFSMAYDGNTCPVVVRYTSEGVIDQSFGNSGRTLWRDDYFRVNSVATQSDGRVILAGYHYNYNGGGRSCEFALGRLNADGSRDQSFGVNGLIETDINHATDVGVGSLVQDDDGIVIVGSSGGNFAVAKYHSDGSLDTKFDGDGLTTTDFGSTDDAATDVAVQSDGKLIVVGVSGGNFALARYDSAGVLDSAFGASGRVLTDFGGGGDAGVACIVQADGKILVAGTSNASGGINSFAMARYNTDGSLDSGFDGDGRVLTSFVSGQAVSAQSLTVQEDGKILLGGRAVVDGVVNFAVARYNSNGSLDSSFGMVSSYRGTPILISPLSSVIDVELAAAATGYSGATLTICRHGGPNAEDVFSSKVGGPLSRLKTGEYFSLNGVAIGRVLQNSEGLLKIGFSTGATQSLVNQAIEQIYYSNSATTRLNASTIQLDWTFSDGNTGSQGAGGALTTTMSSTLHLAAINVAPVVSAPLSDFRVSPGQTFEYTVPSLAFTDPNGGDVLSYSMSSADGASLPPWLTFNAATRTFRGQPDAFDDGLAVNVRVTATDAAGARTSDVFRLWVGNNHQPTGDIQLTGRVQAGQTLSATTSALADVDGMGALAYQWQSSADGGGHWTDLAGATGASYAAQTADVGQVLRLRVSWADGGMTAEAVYSPATEAVKAANTAPTVGGGTALLPEDGRITLSASHLGYSDANGDSLASVTLTRLPSVGVLTVNGLAASVGQTISAVDLAAGKLVFTPAADANGHAYASLAFTASDSLVSSAAALVTFDVTPTNDRPTGAVTLDGVPELGHRLTAATGAVTDIDGLGSFSYQWLANGSPIAGATASSFTLGSSELGKAVAVRVSYVDGGGTTETVTSAASAAVTEGAPGLRFSNSSGLVTTEAGGSASFGVALAAMPRYDVTVTFTISDTTEGSFAAAGAAPVATRTITFTSANWASVQTVTLTGVDDTPLADGDMAYTVSTQVSSADLRYDGMRSGAGLTIANIVVTNRDDDQSDEQYGDNGGTVSADLLYGGSGASDLYGRDGRDELHGGRGHDRLYGGTGDDVLYGDGEDDELEGDQGNDSLDGGSGHDLLTGGTGRDTLRGGDGNDTLDGSSDADSMDGGNGSDTYYVDNPGDVVSDSGSDAAADTVYIATYLSSAYVLGNGIERGSLDNAAGSGSLTGNAGANTLDGNSGNNALDGGAGNDSLAGGAGNDSLSGGAGNDTAFFGADNSTINLAAGTASGRTEGADSLFGIEAVDAGAGNDSVTGSIGNDTVLGGSGNDSILTGAGNDSVNAGDGNDLIVGGDGAGDDVYVGGAGIDTVRYTSAVTGITVNIGTGTAIGAEIGSDTLNQIESVIGGQSGDVITGDAQANQIDGYTGNDSLVGGAGNDSLTGGIGSDSLVGGAGDDLYLVDAAGDVIVEVAGAGNDRIWASANYTLAAGVAVESLTLTGTATALTGNELANTLWGSALADSLAGGAGNDTLSGQAGNDTLNGGAGSDSLVGGVGDDLYLVDAAGDVVVEAAGAGNDRLWASANYTLASGVAVESMTLTGTATALTGNELANTLWGGAQADSLAGGAGNDTLSGQVGNDTLNGGAGSDSLVGGVGDDLYLVDAVGDVIVEAAGAGNDRLWASANYTLASGVAVESMTLTGTATALAGNELANTLWGGALGDRLAGGAGNDSLSGAAGNDTLIGGAGNDTLSGGAGRDVFRLDSALSATTNVDRISDFSVLDDTLELENAVFTTLTGTGSLAAAAFVANLAGRATTTAQRIVYDSDGGQVYYDADGSGSGSAVLLVNLSAGLALTAADFVVT